MNIGLCRKSTTGAMCPSYIATREEEHATRGRANALVKALSEAGSQRRRSANERLHEILDLCLMCKACKAECPLGVDMAKLKSETLSHYHDVHGVPLRSRVFGAIRTLNRLGLGDGAAVQRCPARFRCCAGWLSAPSASPPQRPLPRFERQNLVRWFRDGRDRTAGAAGAAPQGTVNLPRRLVHHLHRAAHRPRRDRAAGGGRLGRASWLSTGCCGRSALSKGLVDEAADEGAGDGARPWRRTTGPGSPIVGCEPSCLFTLRDEHLSMLPGRPATSRASPGASARSRSC